MALPTVVNSVLDNYGDSLQQLALLAYLRQGEEAQPFLEAITAARLYQSAYKKFSKEDELAAARLETTLAIAKWVKDHPRARQSETQAEVQRQVELFKIKIKDL